MPHRKRASFFFFDQARITDDVDCHDRCEATLYTRCGQRKLSGTKSRKALCVSILTISNATRNRNR
jgi:hypothetical protein